MRRIFFAHPKGMDDFDHVVERLRRACDGTGPNELIMAKDDHAARFAAAGSWEAWERSVVGSHMGQPRFDVIVVGDGSDAQPPVVGKATNGLVRLALHAQKPVVWWNGDATFVRGYTFRKVTGVRPLGDDWTRFATLVLE